jgi:hypothetical protein
MNLTDLRAQLESRATEVDDKAATDLVPGTHRKVRQTKRRRIATTVAGVAVVAFITVGLVGPALTSSAPDPADTPPVDYTKDGVTFHGKVGDDRLDKAWIGKPGEGPLEFTWRPTTDNVVLRSFCRSTASTLKMVRVWINNQQVADLPCTTDGQSSDGLRRLTPDDALWIGTPLGKPAKVKIAILDNDTLREGDSSGQLGLGIYNSQAQTTDEQGIPTRIPSGSPGDISKESVRYRSKVGGNTLAGAAIGDLGQKSVQFTFRSTGVPLIVRPLCTANATLERERYEVRVRIGNLPERRMSCFASSFDAGNNGGVSDTVKLPASAEPVQVTATVVGKNGEPLTDKNALLALGVYYQGAQRVIDATVSLDEITELNGYNYKLADLKTADAATTQRLTINLPTGKPFALTAGSTALGNTKEVSGQVTGAGAKLGLYSDPREPGNPDDFGVATNLEPAGTSSTATLQIQRGQAAKGKYILAVYLPME